MKEVRGGHALKVYISAIYAGVGVLPYSTHALMINVITASYLFLSPDGVHNLIEAISP